MSRIILMALVLAATVAGCNRFPDLTVQIADNLAPSDPPECGYESEQEEVLLRGAWDLNVISDYLMVPRLNSYIIDNSLETQATQGNFSVTSYDVTIKLPDGSVADLGGLPNPYQVTTTGVIPPNLNQNEVSRGIAAAPVIPRSYQGAIGNIRSATGFDSIVVELLANGQTAGGFSQQSPAFNWPVEICDGCLGVQCVEGENRVGDPLGCTTGQDNGTYCAVLVPPLN